MATGHTIMLQPMTLLFCLHLLLKKIYCHFSGHILKKLLFHKLDGVTQLEQIKEH